MHEGNPVLNIHIGGNGASTARLYIFVECAQFLQSLFTVSIHCAPEMSEVDCIGRIESFWPKFVRGW